MDIILTGDIGEVTRGNGMMRIVRDVDGFIKESLWGSSFSTLELGMMSPKSRLLCTVRYVFLCYGIVKWV